MVLTVWISSSIGIDFRWIVTRFVYCFFYLNTNSTNQTNVRVFGSDSCYSLYSWSKSCGSFAKGVDFSIAIERPIRGSDWLFESWFVIDYTLKATSFSMSASIACFSMVSTPGMARDPYPTLA